MWEEGESIRNGEGDGTRNVLSVENLFLRSRNAGFIGAGGGSVLHANITTISDIGGRKLGYGWRHSNATSHTSNTSLSTVPSTFSFGSTNSMIFDLS